MVHELKCWPEYFGAMAVQRKNFEVRKGEDRQYKEGDELVLREWDAFAGQYTGRQVTRTVIYVMHGGPWLPSDVWVLGLK